MTVSETLRELGGFATYRTLRQRHSRKELVQAHAAGAIVRESRGRYAVPEATSHAAIAHRYTAVQSHLSAALAHGWKVKTVPDRPWLLLTPGRRIPKGLRDEAEYVCRATLSTHERKTGVTAPLRTVIDCARELPFDEALAVADSALRSKKVRREDLRAVAAAARGHDADRIRTVVAAADGRAANPFESVLRAIVLEIDGLHVIPQAQIAESGLFAVVDLADRARKLVIEAEGYETHGTQSGFLKDVRRYSELAMYGWRVLRFTWIDVMFHPQWVRWVIETWLAVDDGTQLPPQPDDSPGDYDRAS